MAVPYYQTPSLPFEPRLAAIPSENTSNYYQGQQLHSTSYIAEGRHIVPYGGGGYPFMHIPYQQYYSAPITCCIRPQYVNQNLPFAGVHPIKPAPLRPYPLQPPPVHYVAPALSYRSQLRQMAKRIAEFDARVENESKRLKVSHRDSSPFNASEFKLTPQNTKPLDLKVKVKPAHKNIFVRNDLISESKQSNLEEQPGLGQQCITKMRNLVDDIPNVVVSRLGKIPSTERKGKRIDCKPSFIPRTWYIDPGLYENDNLILGLNGTMISRKFYETISWNCFRISTKILVQYYFSTNDLATRKLDKSNALDEKIIDDIVSHVVEKCGIDGQSVRNSISWICTDEALKRQLQL